MFLNLAKCTEMREYLKNNGIKSLDKISTVKGCILLLYIKVRSDLTIINNYTKEF